MAKFLMCWNNSYQVNYSINPWMQYQQQNVDNALAFNQFIKLRSILEGSGAEIEYFQIDDPIIPDIVFTANFGSVKNKECLLSNFTFLERTREVPFIKHTMESIGYTITEISETLKFEGAGDCLFDPKHNTVWMGFGFRTSLHFKKYIEEFYADDIYVRPLRLIKKDFYHLDTCFCPLTSGHVIYFEDAFDEHSKYVIETTFGDKAIKVDEQDALNFCCNAVEVNDSIILNSASNSLKSKLLDVGYYVKETSLTEFIKAGGSAKCLTLRLD